MRRTAVCWVDSGEGSARRLHGPPAPVCDVPGDVVGIPATAWQNVGGERVEEDQAQEVQPGLGLDDSPLVLWLAGLVEDR